eukprot:520111-Rhodomonas_salina.1
MPSAKALAGPRQASTNNLLSSINLAETKHRERRRSKQKSENIARERRSQHEPLQAMQAGE